MLIFFNGDSTLMVIHSFVKTLSQFLTGLFNGTNVRRAAAPSKETFREFSSSLAPSAFYSNILGFTMRDTYLVSRCFRESNDTEGQETELGFFSFKIKT